jgi:hypothetical protein
MKFLLSFAATLAALALSAFAGVDLGNNANSTPYDAYMSPVRQVLSSAGGSEAELKKVQALMRTGRNFRYSYTSKNPYEANLPEVTARTKAGDCKAKALWLINQLDDSNVRFVVGKAHYGAKLSHAWVLWRESATSKWYILDCTNNSRPIAADTVRRDDYIPLYSWGKGGVYRHAAVDIGLAAVAGKRTPVAAE